jgi:hypothetical protein
LRSLDGWLQMAIKAQGDFAEHRALILAELQRLNALLETLREKIDQMNTLEIGKLKEQLAVLQFKSGVWGLTAGAIPGIAVALYTALHR